jgi:hypothetical protein
MKSRLIILYGFLFVFIVGDSSSNIKADIPFHIVDSTELNHWVKEKEPQGLWVHKMMKTRNSTGMERFDHADKTYLLISNGLKSSGFNDIELRQIDVKDGIINIVVEPTDRTGDENSGLLMWIERTDKEIEVLWLMEKM